MEQQETPVPAVRLDAVVHGRVQGVGFRYFTALKARELSLSGSAVNRPDGTVEVTAVGSPSAVQQLLDWLKSRQAPGRVTMVEAEIAPATGTLNGFHTG
ncbi:hypothetical protein AL755_00125 (plasmid) [Arthrobacter sp. ERGS1:01]|uniref:acylphosphatase n=1 Tax=Arthrobacter sp. ERGS1:01 TaxID=1704044 RepID=UPI0006B5939E|nr:acylphosphatase [Arthrobacter sp. ERGS1:01]ALE04174.1 hypothetical protein AL755_00125 [Arthrobacter sp. ERGS1:01]